MIKLLNHEAGTLSKLCKASWKDLGRFYLSHQAVPIFFSTEATETLAACTHAWGGESVGGGGTL